jgi:beta-glucosidase
MRPARWPKRGHRTVPLVAAGLAVVVVAGVSWAGVSQGRTSAAVPAKAAPPSGTAAASPVTQAAAIVARMTLTQKITELHGITDSQHQRYVPGIASLGIPPLVITNGPAGVGPGDDPRQQQATALPAPIGLAASFDSTLAYQYGQLIGAEAGDLGANVVEGPDVNIVRVPQGGRTFESLSEDPYLTAGLGTAETKGIQATPGVIAEVKHFTAYSQETNRGQLSDDNIVSGRVLHEIYLPPFQQALTTGGAQGLMCGYALVNGEYSCQDASLLAGVVAQRWGFDGLLQSDFGAARSTVGSAQAGMNLEMQTGGHYSAANIKQALGNGTLSIGTINQLLTARFSAMIRRGIIGGKSAKAAAIPVQQDAAFALSAAEQGIVLLKNTQHTLPLAAGTAGRIAVIGPYAGAAMTGGGGSSHVDPLLTVSPVNGIADEAGAGASVSYSSGSDLAAAVAAARKATVAVVMVGDTESEGHDQPSLSLSGDQNQLVEDVARANPRTVVVVKSGNPVTMPWLSKVSAVVEAWYPGEEDGAAVAAVLFGAVDPSAKLPVTFPASASRTPTSSKSQFPGSDGKIDYSEGLDVGYRGYDAEGITPLFPFGYGLSYTTFRFSGLKVTPATLANAVSGPGPSSCGCNGQGKILATVTATVTNTGTVAGAEVAQLYLGDPKAAGEPPRQLKGYTRVSLEPGQSATVTFPLTGHDLSYWDDAANGWVVPPGTFTVYLGDSSALTSLPLRGQLTIIKSVS